MKNGIELLCIFIVCVIAVFFTGCFGSNPEKPVTPASYPDVNQTPNQVLNNTRAEKAVVDANNKFALRLFLNLCNDPLYANTTVFLSPFSISSAMAISYEGAAGKTMEEIQTVFFFPDDSSQRREGFEQLYTDIDPGDSRYTLKTANALWAEKSYPFLPDYIHTTQTYYHANATNLDFKNQPDISRITINAWIENQTDNRIKDLIPSGGIDPSTRLVITNAVYFKGTWLDPFDKNQTKDGIFYITPGNIVHVQMMEKNSGDSMFRYKETDSLQVLEMPYATASKTRLSMLVILPKANTLTSVEKSLDMKNLSELRNGLNSQRVKVAFPKFTLETKYGLPKILKSMGMSTAFTDQADFSGMDGTRNLFIGDVIHQAFIDVNEEGSEAAAATAVVEKVMALPQEAPIPTFRADHPFIFIIQDCENGNILFLGRVNNPIV